MLFEPANEPPPPALVAGSIPSTSTTSNAGTTPRHTFPSRRNHPPDKSSQTLSRSRHEYKGRSPN